MRRRREGVESPTCNVPFAALLVEVWPLSICQETYAEHISMPRITVDGKRANRVDADLSMGIEDFKPKPLSQATAPIARIETNAIDWSVQSESLLLPNAKAQQRRPAGHDTWETDKRAAVCCSNLFGGRFTLAVISRRRIFAASRLFWARICPQV